jgi:hypothetical protein
MWYSALIRETHSPTKIAESNAQEKRREEWYAPPFSSQQWNNTKVSFHHSDVPMHLQRKLKIGCLPRCLLTWVLRWVHELACKHMICLQAPGLQTMICLQVDSQGLQGLQTYDMFTSTWLAKTSHVPKPRKVIPFVFVGIGPLNHVQIGIHMIPFGWYLGFFAKSAALLLLKNKHTFTSSFIFSSPGDVSITAIAAPAAKRQTCPPAWCRPQMHVSLSSRSKIPLG